MNFVCQTCFSDRELTAFISTQDKIGKCDNCNKEDVKIIRLKELRDFFEELVTNFKIEDEGEVLINLIQEKWNLFKDIQSGTKILNEVLDHTSSKINKSTIKVNFSDEIQENIGYWGELKEKLKKETRFVTDINKLMELGWDGFFESKITIKKSDIFYRARLHRESGQPAFDKSKMSCPPAHLVFAGRANPIGIPFLYLSDNKETILYEVRATYLDEVSIGEFSLSNQSKKNITISDFTETPTLFHPEEVTKHIKSTLLKELINRDLSKPLRRYDSPVDYIPTQFICEFIKNFTDVAGIKFKSSLHGHGNNLVIFDPNIFICHNVEKHSVSKVIIQSEKTN